METLDKLEIFKKNISTFKETSLDDCDGNKIYMTESPKKVINFDTVKDDYVRDMRLSDIPCSSDALHIGNNEKYTFIEFKNGKMNNQKVYDVYYKIYDSLLILIDISDKNISYFRNHLNFILVYNEGKNKDCRGIDKQEVQISPSKIAIGKYFYEEKAKKKFIRFGLDRFEKLYFKEVFTYNEKEFEEKFLNSVT